jgi:CheY-like chemotaxis protein
MSKPAKARVLVVEDEFLVSEMIRGFLAETGYEVAGWAANGREALEAVRSAAPDIILMDIQLPDMDGLEIARLVNNLKPLPIVVLTAYDTPDLLDRAKSVGIVAYLVKPPHAAEIDRTLQFALARFRDVSELRAANENLLKEIAERRRAEDQYRALQDKLQRAQKFESLGLLAGGMARDFNNMLMVILGNAELGLIEHDRGRPVRPLLEDIRKAGQRAADLTAQLLAFAGGHRPAEVPADLNALVGEVLSLLQVSEKASVQNRPGANLPRIPCDPSQLRQALANLLTNALESGGPGPLQIRISTGVERLDRSFLAQHELGVELPAGDYVYVRIHDNGAGFDAETAGKIFDPFFTTKGMSRGLGLAVVLGVVRAHRGAIHVTSEPGKGTDVKLYLPYAGTAETRPEPAVRPELATPPAPPAAAPAPGKGLVLIVDDEDSVRAVSKKLLEAAGFRTVSAPNGLEGVARFRERQADIAAVLLDVCMPGIDGLQTHSLIRDLSRDTPVLFFSGYSDQEVAPVLAADPRAGFLKKPFRPAILIQKLEELIRLKP